MKNLIKVLNVAVINKPKIGDTCNHCGYCCLSEVCSVGIDLTGSSVAPCKLLITVEDKHYCKLADNDTAKEFLGINTGCCAETQREVMQRITSE